MDAAQPAGGSEAGPAPANADTTKGSEAPHGGASPEAANDGVLNSARNLWRDFSALAKDHLELALLETQRAGQSAVKMLVYAVAAALLLVTSWLGLLAAMVIGLAELGLHDGFGVLIVVALNLVGVFVLYRMIRSSSVNLGFPATRRSFRKHEPTAPGGLESAADSATAGAAAGAAAKAHDGTKSDVAAKIHGDAKQQADANRHGRAEAGR